VCRPCHAPHNANVDTGYLWNHALSSATYQLNEGDPAELSTSSKLCLGCHDGTVALDSYGGNTGTIFMTGSSMIGTDLRGSHPIAIDYPVGSTRYTAPDADGNISATGITPTGQYAHLEEGKVQCASCHYAHGSRASYGMFLRVDNTGSQLCMTCHVSPG
jgi:predicted CXXCH cytochrome family protein